MSCRFPSLTCSPLKFQFQPVEHWSSNDQQVGNSPPHYSYEYQVLVKYCCCPLHSYQMEGCCPSHYHVEGCCQTHSYQHHRRQMLMMLWSVPGITTAGRIIRPVGASLYPPYPNTAAAAAAAVEEVRGSGAADVGPYCHHLHAVMTGRARRMPPLVVLLLVATPATRGRLEDFTSSKEERTARTWVRRLQPGVWARWRVAARRLIEVRRLIGQLLVRIIQVRVPPYWYRCAHTSRAFGS